MLCPKIPCPEQNGIGNKQYFLWLASPAYYNIPGTVLSTLHVLIHSIVTTMLTPRLEVNEVHRFGSHSPKLTQLLRKPEDSHVMSSPSPSPKRLRIGERLWFRMGSSAFGSPAWARRAQGWLPVVRDGNLPASVMPGLQLPTPEGYFPFPPLGPCIKFLFSISSSCARSFCQKGFSLIEAGLRAELPW